MTAAPTKRRSGRPPGKMTPEAAAAMMAKRLATMGPDGIARARARASAAAKRALADPEVRARLSAAMKRVWAGKVCPPEYRKLYQKLRRNGISRAAALAEVRREVAP